MGQLLSSQPLLVRCPASCACWPDGQFTLAEQGILDKLRHWANAVDCTPVVEWLEQVLRMLQECADTLPPRRLAHLLAVPLMADTWGPKGTGVAFTYVVAAKGISAPCGTAEGPGLLSVVHLLAVLPLCPFVGTMLADAWPNAGVAAHPGRKHTYDARPKTWFPLIHALRARTEFASIMALPSMYPVCGCPCCPKPDTASVSAVSCWHRWWPRPGKRMFLLAVQCS
jgi:hypothetical protein